MATRLLTINIRRYLSGQPRRKRPIRLPKYIRYKIARSTNINSSNIKIDKELNAVILKKHLHDMRPITVNISIDKGVATVTHFDKNAKQQNVKKEEKKTQTTTTKPATATQDTKKSNQKATVVPSKDSAKQASPKSNAPKSNTPAKTEPKAEEPKEAKKEAQSQKVEKTEKEKGT